MQTIPSWDQTGTPAGLLGFFHFTSSTTDGDAFLIDVRSLASVFPRQSGSLLTIESISCDALLTYRDHAIWLTGNSRHGIGLATFTNGSTVEDRPADVVSQSLIVEDQLANGIRELFALPLALEPAGALRLETRGRRAHGLDRVRRGPKLVRGDVRHNGRLAGSERGVPRGSAQGSRRSHGMAARRSGLGHRDLAPRPRPNLLDRFSRPRVRGLDGLEEVQNVLRA
jgi:hypothetical protein